MTVAELLDRVSSAELTEWMVYERMTGTLGPERADVHAGIVASTQANVHRGKGRRPYKPQDFMPSWDRRTASTPQAMKTLLKSWSRKIVKRGEVDQ